MGCVNSSATKASNPAAQKKPQLILTIKAPTNSFKITASKEDTIGQIKHKIMEAQGIQPSQQQLLYDGSNLEDGKTLAECGITLDATVSLMTRLQR